MRIDELAGRYGVHRTTVFTHLRRRDMPRRPVGLDQAEAANAVRLYRNGMSIRAVARRIGSDRKGLRSALEAAEVKTRSV